MFTIISYDVVVDKRRTKVMKLLKGYGTHVQYSVFELDLDAQEFTTLGRKLRDLIDLNTDSVRCYRLDIAAVQRITIHGIGTVSTEPNHWLV
ncbi:MAG: CRISPR-associated endonuclease Cas2 [Chloroflexales bacterium]